MRLSDGYRCLEIDPSASDEEVKRAYRDLTKVWHPDRFAQDPGLRHRAEEKLKTIHAAYEAVRSARASGAAEPGEGEATPAGEEEAGGWRVRWRGREVRVEDVAGVVSLVESGAVGDGAEVYDPTAGCWAPAEWIPELKAALAGRRVGRYRTRALLAAAVALFLLFRRPTPAGLVLALGLFGLSVFYVFRMQAAGREASGPAHRGTGGP